MGAIVSATGGPSEQEIQLEIERVLSSSVFRGSKRCHDFTHYVCLKTLQGAPDILKERTIAIEVFGRSSVEAFNDDNIVRVGAREVRRRLALYYVSEGAEDPVRIELPTGSYVPVFRYKSGKPNLTAEPHGVEENTDAATPRLGVRNHRKGKLWAVAGVAAAIAIAALWLRPARTPATEFETFWQPAFDSPAPVLLVMPHPIIYQPSSRALRLDMQLNGKPPLAESRAINVPPGELDGSDFVPVFNQYLGFGDAVAASHMSSIFAQHDHHVELRTASKLEFNDLYGSTVVIIGAAFANRWSAEMTKDFRFRFLFEDQSKPWIVDSQGTGKWGLASITDDRRTPEDYILICRLPHAQTGRFMIMVSGLAGFGTEAGGRIVSDPKLLEPVLQNLPKGWEDRNLEMVMKVAVVGGGPSLPTLVATHTW